MDGSHDDGRPVQMSGVEGAASQQRLAEAALGPYGDVPVAYAAFRVVLNDAGDEVVDVEFIRVNRTYCEWGGYKPENLIGHSFLGSVDKATPMWFPYCYRAAVLHERVHDVVYSEQWKHWLSFNVEPSPIEGCCVAAFTIADAEIREREEMTVNLDTSDFIIDLIHVFNGEHDYEAAMHDMLEMLSDIVRPERLLVFERGEELTSCVFEWHDERVPSLISRIPPMPNEQFEALNQLKEGDTQVVESEVAAMKGTSDAMYERFSNSGVERMIGVKLLHDGEPIGYLSANNYQLEEGLDIKRVLDTVATFIGARMAHQQLVKKLEYSSEHDSLTGLLNRRGIDAGIAEHLSETPEGPYVLALVDVDDFKKINDQFGHDIGDVVLQELARSLMRFFPESALIGRNGGDEFLVMLFGEDVKDADELLAAFAVSGLGCEHDGAWHPLSISIGYVEYPSQARDLHDAYSKADAAVYAVKLAGKADVARYSSRIDAQIRSQLGFTSQDITENIPGATVVFRADESFEILFANDELVKLFGCKSYSDFIEYAGGSITGLIHPDDLERFNRRLRRHIGRGDGAESDYVEYHVQTKSGEVKSFITCGRVVVTNDVGEAIYALVIDKDDFASAE